MVSVRVSLLLLCVAVAAHSVSACYVHIKGETIGTTKNFHVTMMPKVTDMSVGLISGEDVGAVITGVKVIICATEVDAQEILTSKQNDELRVSRLFDNGELVTLDVTVYLSHIEADKSKAIKDGPLS